MADVILSVPSLLTADQLDISKGLFENTFEKPGLSDFHRIITGIKGSTRIPIFGRYSGLVGRVKSACDITPAPGGITATNKTWNPKYISDRLQQCYEPLMGTFVQWLLGEGLSKENINNTGAFIKYVIDMIHDAMSESILLKAYYGDTAMVAGTGNSVSSGNLPYFTPIDGFWKQIFAIVAADATKHVTITKNTLATNALQAFNATDVTNQVITNYFDQAFRQADLSLRTRPASELVYICTLSVLDEYQRERKVFPNIDASYQRTESGFTKLQYNGIDVVAASFQDRFLASYFQVTSSGNTSTVFPHRFILTTRDNMMIATEQESNLSQLAVNYSDFHKLWYADFGFMLDAKIGLDSQIVAGY